MIIPTASDSGSSNDSSGPLTPDGSVIDNRIHTPADNSDTHHIHISTGEPKASKVSGTPKSQEGHRGRRDVPKLDTDVGRNPSSRGPPLRLERERSPYAHPPAETPKSRDNRFSGEYLMSPDAISPRVGGAGNHRPRSQRPEAHRSDTLDGRPVLSSTNSSLRGPPRPSMDRRASAMPELRSPTSTTAPRARRRPDHMSSDESDNDIARLRARSGQYPPDANPRFSTSSSDDSRGKERNFSSLHPTSPPRTPISTEYANATPLNRETLLHGPGLQHLSNLLEGHENNHHRRASPRPSPQPSPRGSPSASPYPSPPGTPPEHHPGREHPIESLKRYSPSSKPSSPLSSAPSSPKPTATTFNPRRMDQDPGARPPVHRSTRTSSWASPLDEPEPLAAPTIDVRRPSPSPARHVKTQSYEKDKTRAPPTRQQTYAPLGSSGASTLEPARPHQRQRSASNAETRGPRPNLSINLPFVHQTTNSPLSPSMRYMPSPTYPASPAQPSKSSLLDPGDSSRPRSTVPDNGSSHRRRSRSSTGRSSHHHHHRSRSSIPDANVVFDPRHSAPAPKVAFSDQKHGAEMPVCPNRDTGLDEWYTVDGHSAITVCSDCRHDVFGTGYERYFQRQRDSNRGKRPKCSLYDPWMRLACLVTFQKGRRDVKALTDIAEVTADELPCPQSSPAEGREWYHVNDSTTGKAFPSFPVCAHCVWSLDSIFGSVLGDLFHRTEDLKEEETRVCALRSDSTRFAKYLNRLSLMAHEAKESGQRPATNDLIWDVKRETVISPCGGDQILAGHDWHIHPELPLLTVCEECYFNTVRPQIKARSRIASGIAPEAEEVVKGVSCKLYSPRMKQVFERACRERDWEDLKHAVEKRYLLQQDLLDAQARVQRDSRDRDAAANVEKWTQKLRRLERRQDDQDD